MNKTGTTYASRLPARRVVPAFLLLTALCLTGCANLNPFASKPSGQAGFRSLPAPSKKAAAVIRTARSILGAPYAWGGNSPAKGFDCSGLVWWVYAKNGVRVPRVSWEQYGAGKFVEKRDISPGDLVFYRVLTGKSMHVGIVTEKHTFIHSPRSGKRVMESDMTNPFWREHYVGARRLL